MGPVGPVGPVLAVLQAFQQHCCPTTKLRSEQHAKPKAIAQKRTAGNAGEGPRQVWLGMEITSVLTVN